MKRRRLLQIVIAGSAAAHAKSAAELLESRGRKFLADGKIEDALSTFRQAEALCEVSGDTLNAAANLTRQGLVLARTARKWSEIDGLFERAGSHLAGVSIFPLNLTAAARTAAIRGILSTEEGRAVVRRAQACKVPPDFRLALQENIADLLLELDDTAEGGDISIEISRLGGLTAAVAFKALLRACRYHQRVGDFEAGKEVLRQARLRCPRGAEYEMRLSKHEAANLLGLDDPAGAYKVLSGLREDLQVLALRGQALQELGRFNEALDLQRRVLAAAMTQENVLSRIGPLHNLALTLDEMGETDEALDKLQEAWQLIANRAHPYRWNVATAIALLYWRGRADDEEVDRWLQIAEESAEISLARCMQRGSETERIAVLNGLHHRKIKDLLRNRATKNPELAFRNVLRDKGRALYLFRSAISTSETADLWKARTELLRRDDVYAAENQERLRNLETRISAVDRGFHGALATPDLLQIQNALGKHEAMIDYVFHRQYDPTRRTNERFGEVMPGAFVITKKSFQYVPLPSFEDVPDLLREYRGALSYGTQRHRAFSRELHGLLIAPLIPYIGRFRRLLLVPDGVLHEVPFTSLEDQSGKALIRKHELAFLTGSRGIFERSARIPRSSPNPAVIVGDPIASVVAGSLPSTRGECKAVVRNLHRAEVKIGPLATKKEVMDVAAPGVLHLATHATAGTLRPHLDSPNPYLRAAIFLTGGSPQSCMLTASEVSALRLQGTRLVYLSSCSSAAGMRLGSEGSIGLRRAFQVAGADTVIASLFPVLDADAAVVAENFYSDFKVGKDPVSSMAKVQRRLANCNVHPGKWCAFQVYL